MMYASAIFPIHWKNHTNTPQATLNPSLLFDSMERFNNGEGSVLLGTGLVVRYIRLHEQKKELQPPKTRKEFSERYQEAGLANYNGDAAYAGKVIAWMPHFRPTSASPVIQEAK
jgi:hypothetical protein